MDDIIKENKNNPEAMKAINKILKRSKDDSDVKKKLKLHPNPKKKKRAKDDSKVIKKTKQKELMRQELAAWAEKNKPEEGWGLTNKRYKEIRLRKKYIEDGETCDWTKYLQNNGLEITREIYKKEDCLVTINVDGEIWGNVKYHGIVSKQNISNYIENSHLPEVLKINTESSNVEIIREEQSLKRRALGVKVNFNITTKKHFNVSVTERQKSYLNYKKEMKHKLKSKDLGFCQKSIRKKQDQEQFIAEVNTKIKRKNNPNQAMLEKIWLIDIDIDNKFTERIEYKYIGKFQEKTLLEYVKREVWIKTFEKKYGKFEDFNFDIEILK